MNSDTEIDETETGLVARHRFLVLVIIAMAAAFFLVSVALALYNSSGAAQLDLSRPGYAAVRSQTITDDKGDTFPGIGPINVTTLKEFRTLYDTRTKELRAIDAFGGTLLDDATLGIDAPSSVTTQ